MRLKKFMQPMPIAKVLKPEKQVEDVPYYSVTVQESMHSFHPDLPDTKVWAFDGEYPGPTFETDRGQPIQIEWKNHLPDDHFLPVDPTFHNAGVLPGGRSVVHVHGAKVKAEDDGYPESWYTRNFEQTGPTFQNRVYHYPNEQRAMTLWYHDHTMGITRLNAYAGMTGFYLIHDEEERNAGLPKDEYDIPIMLQDRSFNDDGSLFYPAGEDVCEELEVSHVNEVFGDQMVVNGKVWPYMDVEPRAYRLRLLNGANSRYFRLHFNGLDVHLVGTDGGLIEEPMPLDELLLGPSERAELLVDFSKSAGETIMMTNDAPAPFPGGKLEEDMKEVMQFRVHASPVQPFLVNKLGRLAKIAGFSETQAVRTRDLFLTTTEDAFGRPVHVLNGKQWKDPITENPKLGTVEIWRFINVTLGAHPMHLHLIHFQVLDRQPFDLNHYKDTSEIKYTGDKQPPTVYEQGLKDTVNVQPGEAIRIITRFVPYTGTYVWHCHMIEHEDYDMMRPYKIIE